MGEKRFFRDDAKLKPILDSIPKGERSTIIRIALRRFFAIEENMKGVVMNDRKDSKDTPSSNQRL